MKTARLCKLLITNNRYEYVELTGMLVKPEEKAEDENGETVDVDSTER